MTTLPTRCPVRGCGTWTNGTEHWPFCLHHYTRLPHRHRDEIHHLIMHCYESNGASADEAALLRGVAESARFLETIT